MNISILAATGAGKNPGKSSVAPKPWIGALAAGDSIILNICEGEEGEREREKKDRERDKERESERY